MSMRNRNLEQLLFYQIDHLNKKLETLRDRLEDKGISYRNNKNQEIWEDCQLLKTRLYKNLEILDSLPRNTIVAIESKLVVLNKNFKEIDKKFDPVEIWKTYESKYNQENASSNKDAKNAPDPEEHSPRPGKK